MRLSGYGIELIRLEAEHLELVRQWRNQEFVRTRMQFQEIIEAPDQINWFGRLHPENDWYFVATAADRPFGLFHIKNIDRNNLSGEAGGFVGHPETVESILPALAILLLMEFAFDTLQLETLEAKYHPDATAIARMNEQMGYEIFSQEKDGFVRARVGKARFFQQAGKFIRAAGKFRV